MFEENENGSCRLGAGHLEHGIWNRLQTGELMLGFGKVHSYRLIEQAAARLQNMRQAGNVK